MDLLRCEMCNCTITNFNNHKCYYDEHPFDRLVSEMLDYNFGNIHQETPATTSHSAEGVDFNSSAFMNRISTFQSSTFPQSTEQQRHWEVNSTAGTNVRYASSNAIQNENFDYLNSSQGFFFPSAQTFENSDCTAGAENPSMTFSTAASTNTLNPVEQPCTNNFVRMQHSPNISFYIQLPPTSQGLKDPSNYLIIYDPTNVPMNMQSGQSAMQDFEISRFLEKEYDAMQIDRKLVRREENTNFASDLTSINAKYHRNPRIDNEYNHLPALQHASTRTDMIMREKCYDEFLNIQNAAYCNIENRDSYSISGFGQSLLDSQLGMNDMPHYSYKSQAQFDDKIKFKNVF
ncbi:hypothetical protein CDAR_226671 [Caerostris darwini]|uniref:Uncharacterized protein n=1 Tax=Caerostris darwini TaxID=1538125 RepID=A0AAV4TT94_9ARAC|nr:hypothetical protein CDAR_226671 [Caerostris darwini]